MIKKFCIILFALFTLFMGSLAAGGPLGIAFFIEGLIKAPIKTIQSLFESNKPDPDDIAKNIYIRLRDLGPVDIQMTMAGQTLRVPVNRMESFIIPDGIDPSQATGLTLKTLWPDFDVMTYENLPEYRRAHKVSGNLWIKIEPACRPSRAKGPHDVLCDVHRSNKIDYNILGPDRRGFRPKHTLPDVSGTSIQGMELIGYNDDTVRVNGVIDPEADEGRTHDENVYRSVDEHGYIQFMTCLRRKTGPSCKLYFVWRDALMVKINFDTQYLQEWESIKQRTVALLDSLVVDDPDAPAANGRHVFKHPMTWGEVLRMDDIFQRDWDAHIEKRQQERNQKLKSRTGVE